MGSSSSRNKEETKDNNNNNNNNHSRSPKKLSKTALYNDGEIAVLKRQLSVDEKYKTYTSDQLLLARLYQKHENPIHFVIPKQNVLELSIDAGLGSYFSHLPPEIIYKIVSLLSWRSVVRLSGVTKLFYMIATSDIIWQVIRDSYPFHVNENLLTWKDSKSWFSKTKPTPPCCVMSKFKKHFTNEEEKRQRYDVIQQVHKRLNMELIHAESTHKTLQSNLKDLKINLPKSYDQLSFYTALFLACLISTMTYWLFSKSFPNFAFVLTFIWILIALNYQKEISTILKNLDNFELKLSQRIQTFESQLKTLETKQTNLKHQIHELLEGDG